MIQIIQLRITNLKRLNKYWKITLKNNSTLIELKIKLMLFKHFNYYYLIMEWSHTQTYDEYLGMRLITNGWYKH